MDGVGHVVVVGASKTTVESLTACCRRRGMAVGGTDPHGVPPQVDVLVVDLTAPTAEVVAYARTAAANGVRVVTLGANGSALAASLPDVEAVDLETTVDALVAILDGRGPRAARPRMAEPAPRTGVALTPREEHVLGELLAGSGTEVMAERLGISPQTVRTHVQNVLSKLGVNSRAQAAAWALRHGPSSAKTQRGPAS